MEFRKADGPHLRFCVVKQGPISEQKAFEQCLAEVKAYHESYGKDGFSSERTHEDSLERTAKRNAEALTCAYRIDSRPFNSDVDFETTQEEVSRKISGFVRWLT